MEFVSSEAFGALRLLAPGFVAAWVLAGLTVDGTRRDLQRIIEALIFSVFIQLCVVPCKEFLIWCGLHLFAISPWSKNVELFVSMGIGCILGVVFAWSVDSDFLYKILRYFKLTKQSSRPSVWYASFCNYPRYVVLHLEDGRRIYGWPAEWSSKFPLGHIRLIDAIWLLSNESGDEQQVGIDLTNCEFILIKVRDVKFVEFVKAVP